MEKELSKSNRRYILAAVSVGTFMSAFDSSVVNIALPRIGEYFNVPLTTIEWVVMSYLLIISSLLLTYGRLGDMYGHRRIYIAGFIIFTAGSALCGFSPTIEFLIFSRVVQAAGAGMLMAMGPAIITNNTPSGERGRALGVIAVAVSVALTTGPVLGGILTSSLGWQSIFYINLPVGIAGILWTKKVIPGSRTSEPKTFDVLGSAIVFASLISILLPLSYTEKYGWANPYILGSLAMGMFLLLLFIHIERRTEFPMMDISLFSNRLFSMSSISALLNYMAQYSIILLMPFYLQQLRGMEPSRAGLTIIPMPLAMMVVAPISGMLSDRFDIRYISSTGMFITTIGMWLLSGLNINSAGLTITFALVVVGVGFGMFQTPNNSAIMGSVSANRRGTASGVLATMRNIGMVLGVAVSGAVFTGRMHHLSIELSDKGLTGAAIEIQAFTGALRTTFIVASFLAAAAIVTSLMRGNTKH